MLCTFDDYASKFTFKMSLKSIPQIFETYCSSQICWICNKASAGYTFCTVALILLFPEKPSILSVRASICGASLRRGSNWDAWGLFSSSSDWFSSSFSKRCGWILCPLPRLWRIWPCCQLAVCLTNCNIWNWNIVRSSLRTTALILYASLQLLL